MQGRSTTLDSSSGSFRQPFATGNREEPEFSASRPPFTLKHYFKEGRGLRTESVFCDTRDFDIGRRVCAKNWNALRAVGETVNRRLCDAEAQDAMPAPTWPRLSA
jgi:hypothetical protein